LIAIEIGKAISRTNNLYMSSHAIITMRLVYGLIISIVLVLSCIGQDPCKDITCNTVCRGETLWEQKCVNGECVDYQIVEENSPACGYDPCRDVVCDNACFSTELWKMTCLNGECVKDHLIEDNSVSCGYTPPPSGLPPSTLPPSGKVLAEEYEIYSAVIKQRFGLVVSCWLNRDEIGLIVIRRYTSAGFFDYESPSDIHKRLQHSEPSLPQETIEDFLVKNEESYPLADNFNLPSRVLLLEPEELEEIFVGDPFYGWREFYSRYPDAQGILTLSRVGFNADMSRALVYVGHSCDSLFGVGYYLILVKKDGEWSVQDEVQKWIA
jgi:hypothetical protein